MDKDVTLAPGESVTVGDVTVTASRVPELTFERLTKVAVDRVQLIHKNGLDSWSLSDWKVAMEGEFGEAANIIKKLNRIRDGMPSNMGRLGKLPLTEQNLYDELEEELADGVIYTVLLAAKAKINLARGIVWKFNKVSDELRMPQFKL